MMTEKKRIEWLLELQDHPEQLTEEQLQQILADEEMRRLAAQMGFAKRAFKQQELQADTPDVEREWERFAASHAEALDALGEERPKPRFSLLKMAASFIGVLLVSGIAFAAIQVVRHINTSKPQQPTTEQTAGTEPVTSLPADTIKADTIPTEPYVFNNAPLDSMLTTIAAAHGLAVEFENEAARSLRFHFVWKPEDSLARIVEKLNTFEAVNICQEDKKLVVR